MKDSRNPPADVARQLRKEAFFGCVKCGFPFVNYHHIVPWSQEHHFRPEDMVAVCPNCHAQFEKMSQQKQRSYKKNPHNRKENNLWSRMEFSIPCGAFAIGSSLVENCRQIAAIDEHPLLAWRLVDGSVALDAILFSRDGTCMLKLKDNEIWINPSAAWDISFKFNHIILRSAPRNLLWELDLRKDPARFLCKTFYNGCEIYLGKDAIKAKSPYFEESSVVGFKIINADTAVQFESGRDYIRSSSAGFTFPLGPRPS